MARIKSFSPLKGCFSSLATRTHAVVARRGVTKPLLMAVTNPVERAPWERRKRWRQELQSFSGGFG